MRGTFTLALAAFAAGVAATAISWGSSAVARTPAEPRAPSGRQAGASTALVGQRDGGPRERYGVPKDGPSRYPPRIRIAMRVPRTTAGVRCPDGSYLPLLNGVPAAPPIRRSARLGPVPPVVAKIVDETGVEWYEHADGSVTTTRFREVIADGVRVPNVETVHSAALGPTARRQR